MEEKNKSIVATVIVSYNRQDLLKQCLQAQRDQVRKADYIIVVDNASTDSSIEVAKSFPEVDTVVQLSENTGGAGGFASGIAEAVCGFMPDFVWIMDDDTVPEPTALQELLAAKDRYDGLAVLFASEALWHDGQVHPMNKPRTRPFLSAGLRRKAEQIGTVSVRSASFVSVLIEVSTILEYGLPMADFFIWNDDFEYTTRLLKRRVGLYVPASKVKHLTKELAGSDKDPKDRFYFEVRNKMWTYLYCQSLSGFEKIVYCLATIRRWCKTIAVSKDRKLLIKCLISGLKDGLHRPRSTYEVLADSPVAKKVVGIEVFADRM